MTRTECRFTVGTPDRVSPVNVTRELQRAVRERDLESGLVCAFVPHATCARIVNKDEAGLQEDVLRRGKAVIEPLGARTPFTHDRVDDNAPAHAGAVLLQPSVVIPISQGVGDQRDEGDGRDEGSQPSVLDQVLAAAGGLVNAAAPGRPFDLGQARR